jgi:hypothetical protein
VSEMRTCEGKKVNLANRLTQALRPIRPGYSNLTLGPGFKIGAGLHLNILSFK